jgi:hypothetical protein
MTTRRLPKFFLRSANSEIQPPIQLLTRRNSFKPVLRSRIFWASVAFLVLFSTPGPAFQPRTSKTDLDAKQFSLPELTLNNSAISYGEAVARNLSTGSAWEGFFKRYGSDFTLYFDPRSGTPMNVVGHMALIPGKGIGNNLTLGLISQRLGHKISKVGADEVAALFSQWILQNQPALAIDVNQLGKIKATEINDYLWQIYIPQQLNGIPVRWGRFAGTINHGNIVLAGTENWGNVKIDTTPSISAQQALKIGFEFVGGRFERDRIWKEPALEIVPIAPPEFTTGEGFSGPLGLGYGHRLVWVFGFQRTPELSRWEIGIDAHTSEVLYFTDKNDYIDKTIRGGVYPITNTFICPDNIRCGIMQPDSPMPWADTGLPAPNDFTNSAGVYQFTAGQVTTTTFNGLYMKMVDTCGPASESSANGKINLGGVNGDTDCVSGGTSPGNTPASRSGFYELNKNAEEARGLLPNNTWLQAQLTANMNLNAVCNAFWDGSTVNFFASGGGCRNTGEIAAVFDHEWGHGLDQNDANQTLSNSSEGYADIAAMYRLWQSCVGYGFWETNDRGCGMTSDGTGFNNNEAQQGAPHCDLDCSGVRDSDWAKHFDGLPDGVAFVCTSCSSGGGQSPSGSGGPCGRQVHCAATPVRQAAWDLVARDFPNLGLDDNTSFIIADKLFLEGSGNIGNWNNCTCPSSSDGCGATNGYMQWLGADDDNGNIADGTPHMTAIFDAYNRHDIACAGPVPTNSGCGGGPTTAPTVTTSTSHNQVTLNWNTITGASSYFVFRSEGYAGCSFGKALIATVNGTSYVDNDVSNGRVYSYVVMAVGSSSACLGPASSCVQATPQPCAGAVEFDAAVYSCNDTMTINLLDSDLTGNGTQSVSLTSTTETNPETAILTETPANSGSFTGTFSTTSAPPSSDGLLSVVNGDTITVTYNDASFCGPPQVVTATAVADCVAPVISNVQITNVTDIAATFTWDTNETANARVTYAPAPGPPNTNVDDLTTFGTTHSITATGLTQCTDYVASVTSTDIAGNPATDDNGGNYYTFTTGGVGVAFFDDAENGLTNWVAAGGGTSMWHNSTCQANSGTHSFKAGQTACPGIYDPDVFTTLTTANTIPLGPAGHGYHLKYFERYDTEDNIDFCQPQISLDGGTTWTTIATYSGTTGGSWIAKDYDLSSFGSTNAKIRFLFTTDPFTGLDGWYIDDIKIARVTPCAATLQYFSNTITDDCPAGGTGDGDGVVDPGETIDMIITTENVGLSGATGISATLSTTTPGVTITTNNSTYPDIPAGGFAPSNNAFRFDVSATVTCGTLIQFTIDYTANEGTWSDTFTVLVGGGPPSLLLNEDFSAGIPGTWTVIDGGSGGGGASTWTTLNPGGRVIDPPFADPFAIVDSDAAGAFAVQDETLITPSLNASTCSNLTLEFSNQFHFFSEGFNEVGDVDASTDGGSSWTNALQMTGLDDGWPNPNTKSVDLSSIAAFQSNLMIRFHYYNGNFDNWWAIDNVKLTCTPLVCHNCSGAPCLFCDDFNDGVLAANWTYIKPTWTESNGSLNGTPVGRKAIAVATPAFAGCTNCAVQTMLKTAGGVGNRVWLLAWYVDKRNTMELMMKEESDKWVLKQRVNGAIVAKVKASATIDSNVFYNVVLSYNGTQFQLTVDGVPLLNLTPVAAVPQGTVGYQDKNTTVNIDNINVN